MNMSADNIILNSCQYTPVYFIENPGVSQARSYYLAPNIQNAEKPVSESLKRFYENSGKLESNLSTTHIATKPKNVKKVDTNVVGNNLKLASFLLPKSETKPEPCPPTITPVNNVLLKPVYISNNRNVNNINNANTVPKIDVNSRLVKLKDLPDIVRSQNGRILPKMIKPKESSPSSKLKQTTVQAVQPVQPVPPVQPMQPMPVQLVKFGETYHSLNQLSDDQMLIVNHALKMFNNTQPTPEAAYDPATNTKFIYKVVSQKDFVERNKVNIPVTTEIKKEPVQVEIIEEDYPQLDEDELKMLEAKVTRSGRVVKLPKNIILDDSPTKSKRKANSVATCLQCQVKFGSPQRLQRHYENHPTHIQTNLHNNLFHCLIAIVTAGPESKRAAIMLQQLEQLIVKLRSCVPCLLKCDGVKENFGVIGDELSRLFGISPGKYNFNMDSLSCEKDKDGYCDHNPRPQISVTDNVKPQTTLENIDNNVIKPPSKVLKVNFQDRRPKILRKVECRKQKLEQSSHNVKGKKMKLSHNTSIDKTSNSTEIDDLVALLSDTKTENNITKVIDEVTLNEQREVKPETVPEKVEKVIKPPHIQFHSSHFDIRSSPIKSTSTVFRKFQINPEKMTKYIEVIRPLQLNQLEQGVKVENNANSVNNVGANAVFSDTNIITSKESENFNYTSKNWCEEPSNFMKSNDLINGDTDSFIDSNAVIKPTLLHVQNGAQSTNDVTNESVLNHVKNDTEIMNKVDDLTDFIKSNMFAKELAHDENDTQLNQDNSNTPDFIKELISIDRCHQENNVNNQTYFMKSNILIEPLLAQNNHELTNTTDHTNKDFKSDILIDQTLLNDQNCKLGDIDRNDYNLLIEPSLMHSQDAKMDIDDNRHNYITTNDYINPTLQHSLVNSITNVAGNDMDDNTNQGQSIISFLESLGNELAYTETDRNNPVDFQLDLFSFNNS
ncbi:homeobox-like protein HDP1 [Bicyclus anynana]|uniref:Homeobox-like protein HDP1 n=1 Tax=Bicyclus anynana TaxID=110368 RepID=A0A6J1NP74_BICAN|nr:homeobox-like protein HDP1 [Bicyclus anynana]